MTYYIILIDADIQTKRYLFTNKLTYVERAKLGGGGVSFLLVSRRTLWKEPEVIFELLCATTFQFRWMNDFAWMKKMNESMNEWGRRSRRKILRRYTSGPRKSAIPARQRQLRASFVKRVQVPRGRNIGKKTNINNKLASRNGWITRIGRKY